MEALYFGHRLTGDVKFLSAFKEMFETAYKHVTGDAAALAIINPGVNFPPQNCFIHTALQHDEGNSDQPWCSGWMVELVIDPLLEYEQQTGDNRSDEIIVRLARFIRDTGSAYFTSDLLDDTFLKPTVCDDPTKGENRRRLLPLYGAGGSPMARASTEATTMTTSIARIPWRSRPPPSARSSVKESTTRAGPSVPSPTRASRSCSFTTNSLRARNGSSRVGSAPAEILQPGPAHRWPPDFPTRRNSLPTTRSAIRSTVSPERKLSWWFNHSMLQYGLLLEAGVAIPKLTPGKVQPSACP